eukprot:2590380-Ditylum_brightwellii.AAC.1
MINSFTGTMVAHALLMLRFRVCLLGRVFSSNKLIATALAEAALWLMMLAHSEMCDSAPAVFNVVALSL